MLRSSNKIKNLWVNLFLVGISIFLSIFLIEVGLRICGFSIQKPLKCPPLRNFFKPDDELGADIKKNVKGIVHQLPDGVSYPIWSNELGCFDMPYNGEKEVIYLTGDSFALGWVPLERKWGSVIQNVLGIRVLKCGGFGEARTQLLKCKMVISKIGVVPKLFIASYCIVNDLTDRWGFGISGRVKVRDGYLVSGTRIENPENGDIRIISEDEINKGMENWQRQRATKDPLFLNIKRWLSFNSYFYAGLRQFRLIQNISDFFGLKTVFNDEQQRKLIWEFMPYIKPENGKYQWVNRAWEVHLNDLKMFDEYSKSLGSKLLYVLIPPREAVYNFLREEVNREIKPARIEWDRPNKILLNFFQENNINYIDLTPLFKKRADQRYRKELDNNTDFYYRFDGHWNENGDRLAGLLITKYILKQNLIEVQNRDKIINNIEKSLAKFTK